MSKTISDETAKYLYAHIRECLHDIDWADSRVQWYEKLGDDNPIKQDELARVARSKERKAAYEKMLEEL